MDTVPYDDQENWHVYLVYDYFLKLKTKRAMALIEVSVADESFQVCIATPFPLSPLFYLIDNTNWNKSHYHNLPLSRSTTSISTRSLPLHS